MLDRLRTVDTVSEDADEEDLQDYACSLQWYINPNGSGIGYTYFRSLCFFPPELIGNQGVYLHMPEGPLE